MPKKAAESKGGKAKAKAKAKSKCKVVPKSAAQKRKAEESSPQEGGDKKRK